LKNNEFLDLIIKEVLIKFKQEYNFNEIKKIILKNQDKL